MPKEFAKLQAQDMGKVGAIQDLLRGIEKILPKNIFCKMIHPFRRMFILMFILPTILLITLKKPTKPLKILNIVFYF